MKSKIKFLFLISLMLCVFSTLAAQTDETFDGYYDDKAVINTTLKTLGEYNLT